MLFFGMLTIMFWLKFEILAIDNKMDLNLNFIVKAVELSETK